MNKPLNTSPWLLLDDPDLTPEQVWSVYAWAGQDGVRVLRDGVVIADTAQQAFDGVKRFAWTPVTAANEAELADLIARADEAYVRRSAFGADGTERFMLVFRTEDRTNPFRFRWVQASTEAAARSTWPDQGEEHAPLAVLPLAVLVTMRDQVRQVRLARGAGAMNDARDFPDRADRLMKIDVERIGEEKFKADLEWLKQWMAEPEAGSTP